MWVLSRLEIRVTEFPKWGDRIRLFTGGRGADKLFAFREFMIWDQNERVIARAMSSWLLLNSETKRIQRPEQVLPPALFDPNSKPTWQPEKITVVGETIAAEEIRVRHSDLDLNNHVNNTSYIRWAENFLADQGVFPAQFLINYSAECLLGEQVELKFFKGEGSSYLEGRVGRKTVFLSKI